MKYVRVYESDCYPEEYVTTYLNHCEHVANLQNAGFDFEGCIVKQADTIEELCDEFIVVHENGNHVIQKKVGNGLKDMDKDYPKYLERNNQVFYGAIWTDKGLIYVAKMNEKGELCLI